MTIHPIPTGAAAEAGTFAEILADADPHTWRVGGEDVQAGVTAALGWFLVTGPQVAAAACTGRYPLRIDVPLDLAEITRARAVNPAMLRGHTTVLRDAFDKVRCRRALSGAGSPALRQRVGEGRSRNGETFARLMADMADAAGWMAAYGSRSGQWAFRWMQLCSEVADFDAPAVAEAFMGAVTTSYAKEFAAAVSGTEPTS